MVYILFNLFNSFILDRLLLYTFNKIFLYSNKLNFNIAIPIKSTIYNIKDSKKEKNIYQNEKLKWRLEELKELYRRGLISQEEYKYLNAKELDL